MRLSTVVFALVLLSVRLQATDYVNVLGALLHPGMTQTEVESALQNTGSQISRNNEGPNAIWSIITESDAKPSGGREYSMQFRDGKLQMVSRTVTVQKGNKPDPDAAAIVNTLFSLLRTAVSERGRVAFLTDELSQDTVRNRTVAFFVGEKIFMLSVLEPVGSHSLVTTSVQIEERMEAQGSK